MVSHVGIYESKAAEGLFGANVGLVDLVKQITCEGSSNFLENTWKGWPEKGEQRHIFNSLH